MSLASLICWSSTRRQSEWPLLAETCELTTPVAQSPLQPGEPGDCISVSACWGITLSPRGRLGEPVSHSTHCHSS